ncbi:MAG: phosphatidate cytidylyltransferase, partial [Methylophilaceae bacterium]
MLKARILTSLVLVPLFLAALFLLPDVLWALLMLVAITVGAWEWGTINGFKPFVRNAYALAIFILGAMLILALEFGETLPLEHAMFWGIACSTIFWVVLVPAWLSTRYQVKNLLIIALAGLLVLLPTWFALMALRIPSLLALVDVHGAGPALLLGIMVAVWIADSAAYFAGKRFGKHKLAVKISPGKTWEGVLGAWLAVSIYGFILCITLHVSYWLIVALWGITVLSIMGDLLESLIKRHANVKDSGNILPGHGGML